MKILSLTIVACGLFLTNASVALATPETPAGTDGSQGASPRAGKTAYGALELIGFTMMPVNGARLGYFINPNLAAELGYAAGGARIGSFESKKQIIEAKAKYFIGDTFYVDGAIAHEMWTAKYSVLKTGSLVDYESAKGSVSNTGVELHIGNQWQVTRRVMDWELTGLFVGCDWLGYFKSVSTKSSFSPGGNLDPANKKLQEKSVQTSLGGSSLHLARLYVGWAF